MRHPNAILETYRRGDKLSDEELEFLRKSMQDIADSTSRFGDLFTLQLAMLYLTYPAGRASLCNI